MPPVLFISCHYIHFIDGETEACQDEVTAGEPNSEPRTASNHTHSRTCNDAEGDNGGGGGGQTEAIWLGFGFL